MRLTVLVRAHEGLEAKLRARTARQRRNVLAATTENREEEFVVAQSLAPRRTNFMADHMLEEPTYEGFGYVIGFRRNFFVGLRNPVTNQVVTRFYAVDVIHGNRRMAGNDFLTAARHQMRARIRGRYVRALKN